MKKIKPILFISVFIIQLLISNFDSYAQTKVSSLFGNHMVLQQDTEVAIWGTDKPNTQILVKTNWGEKKRAITDANGEWKLFIKTVKAGGPYSLTIKGSEKVSINDIMLGEVWLCSGQSNMEMPIKGFIGQPVNDANELVLNSFNHNLRLFNVKKNVSAQPLNDCEGSWNLSAPLTVSNFSAIAYIYGSMLQKALNVPVGIICSSVGGTPIEAWTDHKTLTSVGFDHGPFNNQSEVTSNSPSSLFNAMINPLIPYTIKGVIWYQGESNRHNAAQYQELFPAMINSWRKRWDVGEFPFYYTQIAPFEYGSEFNSAFLREAQLHTLLNTPNTGMAVTLDLGEQYCIHPAKKTTVAKRLCYWALAKTYNFQGLQYSGPIYKSMKITDNKVEINFDYAQNGVSNFGKELDQFTIAGEDKIFYPAIAEIERGKLTIHSDKVLKPIAVRYAWKNYVEGTLYNLGGLPASSFRTDNWEF